MQLITILTALVFLSCGDDEPQPAPAVVEVVEECDCPCGDEEPIDEGECNDEGGCPLN